MAILRTNQLRACLALLAALLLGACANPYTQNFTGTIGQRDMADLKYHAGEPSLRQGTNHRTDASAMWENGYYMVGYSNFDAGRIAEGRAMEQAKKIRAEIVIVYSKYRGTVTSLMAVTVPTTQTTEHSGTISGSGAPINYSSTSKTTGTRTDYIPYSVDRFGYLATYWVKRKEGGLGIAAVDLTPMDRRALGANYGVVVTSVTKGGAAFKQDILIGDVIVEVDGERTRDFEHLLAQIKGKEGRNIEFRINRRGAILRKTIFNAPHE